MEEKFEKATRSKVRFEYKGQLSVEDLWDLSREELDTIYRDLTKQKNKLSDEDSLLNKKTEEDKETALKISLVKYIFEVKTEEANAKLLEKERKEKKQKIMEVLANKQEADLHNKSTEELEEMLNSL
ncbi:MAG: hypothetical protein ACQESN_11735 [Thermotogota bacterium]